MINIDKQYYSNIQMIPMINSQQPAAVQVYLGSTSNDSSAVHASAGRWAWSVWLGGGLEHFYFPIYWGWWSNLTNMFGVGWNHQPDIDFLLNSWIGFNMRSILGARADGLWSLWPCAEVGMLICRGQVPTKIFMCDMNLCIGMQAQCLRSVLSHT